MFYGSAVSIRVRTGTTSRSQLHKLAAIFRILVSEPVLLACLFRVCFPGRRDSCDTLRLCPSFVLLFSTIHLASIVHNISTVKQKLFTLGCDDIFAIVCHSNLNCRQDNDVMLFHYC